MTVYRRLFSILFSTFTFQFSFAMSFDQELCSAIISEYGYSVMTVTRNAKIISVDEGKATYAPFRALEEAVIEKIFENIENNLLSLSEPVLVVFNEYFFARKVLDFNDFTNKLDIIYIGTFTKDTESNIFC